jgi:AAA family ATP:ADP antiporter
MLALLQRVVQVKREEAAVMLWSFAYFFCLLAAYYMIRPVRDEMAVQYGSERLQHLFTATFVVMVALIPLFGWLASRLPVNRLLPTVYLFFAGCLVAFYLALSGGVPRVDVAPFFFVFVSVFNLFVVSVFWSFMADLFSNEASRRLFGFISAGGSLGAIAGPSVAALLVTRIGIDGLLLASAGTLALTLVCIGALLNRSGSRRFLRTGGESGGEKASLWVGVARIAHSPYLIAICLFVILYTVLGTLLYFQQVNLVKQAIPSAEARTQLFASVDLAVNTLTLVIQFFLTGRLLSKLGATFMLAALPVLSVVGFAALGVAAVLPVLVVFGVLRRAGEFAVSKPTRETLFTVVPKEDKYQAKNVIDTVIHRGGDAASSWFAAALQGLGLSASGMAFTGVPIALVWLGTALYLGRRHEELRESVAPAPAGAPA